MSARNFAKNPPSESCRLIDFDSVDVVPGIVPNTFFVIVRGTTPCINMTVSLSPRIYIRCPEFWGIEVIGCLPGGICLPAIGHYEKVMSLIGITGSEGIEIVGATKREKRKVAGGCHSALEFEK